MACGCGSQRGTVEWDGESLVLDGETYRKARRLGEGKSASSSLYTAGEGDRAVVVKKFETKAYNAIPHGQALDFELESYSRMVSSGIAVPRLRGFDREAYLLVKDYVEGPVAIEAVAEARVPQSVFRSLFFLAGQLRRAGWHVDFYPANFVVNGGRLWCIDYEAHPYNPEWDLVEWGIWYWLNAEGIRATLANPDAGVLNYPGTFKPRREGLEVQRDQLLHRYGKWA